MKNILINKLKEWSFNEVQNRHNINDPIANYIWDTTTCGVFLYRRPGPGFDRGITGAHFFSNDGTIYKITNRFTNIDFECHSRLFELSQQTNKIRIDIPISHDYFEFESIPMYYSVVQRPNKEYGDRVFANLLDGSITNDDLHKHIESVATVLSHLKSLNCPMPNIGLDIIMRMTDSVGEFWTDFKIWDTEYNKFVDKTFTVFSRNITSIHQNSNKFDLEEVLTKAESIWKTI